MKSFKEDNHTRIAILETLAQQTHATLLRLEQKMDDRAGYVNQRFEKLENKIGDGFLKVDSKIERLEDKIDDVRKENKNQFYMVFFTLITLIGTPLMVQGIQFLNHLITS